MTPTNFKNIASYSPSPSPEPQTPTLYAWAKETTQEKVSSVADSALKEAWRLITPVRTTSIFNASIAPFESHDTGKKVHVLKEDVSYLLRRLEDRDGEITSLTREKEGLQDENEMLRGKLEFLQKIINISGISRGNIKSSWEMGSEIQKL